ncbi:hypothetical protein PE067_09240 [Paracoccus sp. DMF-8]|uniref:hypothetical protein n=1 Tax=Paracoccus sp. DMF-8 TaxID=3019445 RepID=UPI0023E88E39|nr:hypothetical protein [Paracoccus sp. DMF-8]MDF3606302.1 hypothetical protein [Paracoccus sp. DMF-8]
MSREVQSPMQGVVVPVKIERRLARIALLHEPQPLKDRKFPLLNAVRAKEMLVLMMCQGVLVRIYPVIGFRPVKFVIRKFGVYSIRRCQIALHEGNLHLQKVARDLRISYLRVKLVEGGYDIRVSTALRLSEQSLKLGTQVGNLPEAVSEGSGPLYRGLKVLWREVQVLLSGQCLLSQFAEQLAGIASVKRSRVVQR